MVQEITSRSWGQRIVGSFVGALVGIALFLGSFIVLWWGEGRSVERAKTLDEGRGLVVAVASERVDPSHNGALVHFTGKADTDETLEDDTFGISAKALKLNRIVEMYQWKEESESKTEEHVGGRETTVTNYSYKKVWSDNVIDSSEFKEQTGHENPANMPYEGEPYEADDIHVGAFQLTEPFVEQLNDFSAYPLSDEDENALPAKLRSRITLQGNEWFTGDPAQPKIGDVRIRFEIVKPMDVSVIGKQDGDHVISYTTKNGEIELLQPGTLDAAAMFKAAEDENAFLTWLIRAGGVLMMWIGLAMIFGPLSAMGAVIPLLGSLLGAGIGLVAGAIALPLSMGTIALAWLFYRPLIGIILLAIAGGLFFGGWRKIREKLARKKAAA